MHDPMVVAHEILSPIPHIDRRESARRMPQGPRWSSHWYIGDRALWFPPIITIWHVEPDDEDAFTVCPRDGDWKWHVRHWKLQLHPVQKWRRRIMTRCAGCGGRSTKKHTVNHGLNWESPDVPWWYPEQELYHADCASKVINQRAQRNTAEKNQKRWDEHRAQVHALRALARDLEEAGESEAASLATLRAETLNQTIQDEIVTATEAMRADRLARTQE